MADLRELLNEYEGREYAWRAQVIVNELLTVFTADELTETVEAKQDGRLKIGKKKPDRTHCKMCGKPTGTTQFCSCACKVKYYRHNQWGENKRFNKPKAALAAQEATDDLE